jgi:hypothetical protein
MSSYLRGKISSGVPASTSLLPEPAEYFVSSSADRALDVRFPALYSASAVSVREQI